MSYIGYLVDRAELGFSYNKDIHSVEQLVDFTTILKNSYTILTLMKSSPK
jgi:hypothetical protein